MSTEGVPSQEEVDIVVTGAKRYGGSFAKALFVGALPVADSSNRIRIRNGFPELWAKYVELGQAAIEDDKRADEERGK